MLICSLAALLSCTAAWGFTSLVSAADSARAGAIVAPMPQPALEHPMAWYTPPLNPANVLALDDDILRYFDARVTAVHDERRKLQQILDTLLDPSALGFVYDTQTTCDVRETFRRRRGNCVSFALLITALCRHYDLPAFPQVIPLPSKWDRIGNHIVNLHHMNVRVIGTERAYVVDLRPDLVPEAEVTVRRVVPDARALAIFYTNVGFFQIIAGRLDSALDAMQRATEVDPTSAAAWANRGMLHARRGELTAARESFRQSLRFDRGHEMALIGYVGVLQRLGTPSDLKLAAKLERRARAVRDANPYYRESVAQRARDQGDWETAEREFRQAIRLKPDEPAFYVEWADALQHLGRPVEAAKAKTSLAKLQRRLSEPR